MYTNTDTEKCKLIRTAAAKFRVNEDEVYNGTSRERNMNTILFEKSKIFLKTYSVSKSLSLYIQKLLETMSSSSLVPSRPTKTKKEPIP